MQARDYLKRAADSVRNIYTTSVPKTLVTSVNDPSNANASGLEASSYSFKGDVDKLRNIQKRLVEKAFKLSKSQEEPEEESLPKCTGRDNSRRSAINSIDIAMSKTHGIELSDESNRCYRNVMTADQCTTAERFAEHIDATEAHMNDTSKPLPPQLLDLVLGEPGAGKTWLLNVLINLANTRGRGEICRALSFSAKAAKLMVNGTTIHTFGSISRENAKNGNFLYPKISSPLSIAALRTALEGIQYIIIDEVSMLYAVLLGQLDCRLRQGFDVNDKFFGGCNVLMGGDFFQIPPTTGKSIFVDSLKASSIIPMTKHESSEPPHFPKSIGVGLFKKFTIYQLKGNISKYLMLVYFYSIHFIYYCTYCIRSKKM